MDEWLVGYGLYNNTEGITDQEPYKTYVSLYGRELWPSSSAWTSFTKRCRFYWMRTSKNARMNQGRGFHVIGVYRHALESRSVESAPRNGGSAASRMPVPSSGGVGAVGSRARLRVSLRMKVYLYLTTELMARECTRASCCLPREVEERKRDWRARRPGSSRVRLATRI